MDTLTTTRIVGVGIFGLATLLNIFAFIYRYIWCIKILNQHRIKKKIKNGDIITSINFSLWGFFTLITICLVLTYLYAALWQLQGHFIKPLGTVVVYGRWVAFAIIFGLCILYTYTKLDIWENKSFKIQSFFAIFWGVISMVLIVFATLTISTSSKVFSMVSSLIAAMVALYLLFFPNNILFDSLMVYNSHHHHFMFNQNNSHFNLITLLFLISLLLFYIGNVIIWFCSQSNEILLSGVLDLTNETIAYLVFDTILIYFWTVTSIVISFLHKPKIEIKYDTK